MFWWQPSLSFRSKYKPQSHRHHILTIEFLSQLNPFGGYRPSGISGPVSQPFEMLVVTSIVISQNFQICCEIFSQSLLIFFVAMTKIPRQRIRSAKQTKRQGRMCFIPFLIDVDFCHGWFKDVARGSHGFAISLDKLLHMLFAQAVHNYYHSFIVTRLVAVVQLI